MTDRRTMIEQTPAWARLAALIHPDAVEPLLRDLVHWPKRYGEWMAAGIGNPVDHDMEIRRAARALNRAMSRGGRQPFEDVVNLADPEFFADEDTPPRVRFPERPGRPDSLRTFVVMLVTDRLACFGIAGHDTDVANVVDAAIRTGRPGTACTPQQVRAVAKGIKWFTFLDG